MLRKIVAVTGPEGRRIAELACGHTSTGVAEAAIGAEHECIDCDELRMPPDFVAYKETPLFTQDTVPAALLRDHSTKRGVWGRIVVREGRLEYRIDIMNKRWNLDPGAPGTIPPEVPHAVQPLGKVAFLVRFFRAPAP